VTEQENKTNSGGLAMTGEYETLIYEKDGRRASITFNRPHILNAVSERRRHDRRP
jgi:1,4-dihydroxy-2-naphthoyl-CoA synthase